MPAPQRSADVAVIGAGITGAFAATFLTAAGASVVLIERDGVGAHASGRNAAGLNPLHGPGIPGPMAAFALEAFRLHQVHADTIGRPARPVTRIRVALDDGDRETLESAAALHDATPGFSAEWVSGDALVALEPRLSAAVRYGLRTEGNARIDDPEAYTRAVADGALRRGARLIVETALDLDRQGGRIAGIRLASGSIACGAVVLATGPWTAEASRWLGEPLPVEPVKGDLLHVAVDPPVMHDVTWRDGAVYGHGRHAWLGGTTERVGFDESPAPGARASILARVQRFFPGVATAPVVAHLAALRPSTPDGLPIVGPSRRYGNVYLALGGGAKGMLYATAMGRAVADLIVKGTTAVPIDACRPRRFTPAHAHGTGTGETA